MERRNTNKLLDNIFHSEKIYKLNEDILRWLEGGIGNNWNSAESMLKEEYKEDETSLQDALDLYQAEDDLIKALTAAREKKVRNWPPDIKISEPITVLTFHPEVDLIAIGNISGELSVFNYTNGANTIQKKLKLSKKTLRGLEFDDTSLTIPKDKTGRETPTS